MMTSPATTVAAILRAKLQHAPALAVSLALVAALAGGCAPDDTVAGPCGTQPCAADADAGDVAGEVDVQVVRKVDFSVKTKGGKVLDVATTGTIEPDADLYAEQGVQVDVEVVTENVPNGTTVQVFVDGKVVGFANVQNNAATVAKVTLECSQGARTIAVVAKLPAGDVASPSKSLRLDCSKGCVAKIERIDAAAACETQDVDPALAGFQANFRVSVATPSVGCTHASVKGTDTEGKAIDPATNKVPLVGGTQAIVKVTLAPTTEDLDGKTATVQGVVEDVGIPEKLPTPSEPMQVKVATKLPEIAILQPPKEKKNTFTLADDNDKNPKNGIQTTIVGTVATLTTADKGAIKPKLDGKDLAPVTVDIDGTFKIDLDFPASGAYTLQITATNGCGLQNKPFSTTFTAFAGQGKMAIVEPGTGAVLPSKLDTVPATALVYDTQFSVAFEQAPDVGTEVSVYCRKAGPNTAFPPTPAGKATFKDATAATLAIPVTLDVESFGTSQTCIAKDNAANPSTTEKAVNITVALPAPCLKVAAPAGDVTLTTASLDTVLVAQNLEGRDVKAVIAVKGGGAYPETTVGKIKAGLLSAALKLTVNQPPEALPDGSYTISFDAVDALGNVASEQVLAGCADTKRNFTVDTKGPKVAITLPAKATLTAADDPDADASVPGYQVAVEAALPDGDAVQACVTVAGAAAGCQAVQSGATKVQFPSVSLQPGLNFLEVTAADAVGNASKAQKTVTFVSTAPVVSFVQPKGSTTTVSDTMKVTVKVLKSDGAPLPGAKIEVLVDGKASSATVTDNGDGTYTFDVSGLLATGATKVQVGAAAAAAPGNVGYSPVIQITAKTQKPTVTITAPQDGAKLNLASAACVAGVPDCVATVAVATTNAEDDSSVTLTVDCGGAKDELAGTVKANAVSFPAVKLKDQATCQLTAKVKDAAGQEASSPQVAVQVDRTAPAFGDLIAPPLGNATSGTVTAQQDVDNNSANGLQSFLSIQVAGLHKSAIVQCDVLKDDGAKFATHLATLEAAVGDGKLTSISFGAPVTLPDGTKVKLVFTTADSAGNPATRTVTLEVVSAKPLVQITGPTGTTPFSKACTAQSECAPAGVCALGKCALPLNKAASKVITATIVGLPLGGDIRLCSDTPGVGSGDCAQSGYKVVATATKTAEFVYHFDVSALGDGLFHFTAEASSLANNIPWTASLTPDTAAVGQRTVYVDTVSPAIASVQGPKSAATPAGCLSQELQSVGDLGKAGGTFVFDVALQGEDAKVVVLVNDVAKGALDSTNKLAKVPVLFPSEGKVVVKAQAIDLVGNLSTASDETTWTVNTLPPAAQFANPPPGKAVVLAGADLDIKIVADAGSPDLEGQTATLSDVGALKGSEAFSAGAVTFAHSKYGALVDGQHQLTADLKDACGNTAVVATSPQTITVDTKGPTLTLHTPTPGQAFADKDDASTSVGGYQVSAEFTTVDAATWALELGIDCDDKFLNCKGYQSVASGAVKNPGGKEAPVLATLQFGNTPNYALRLTAKDASGNAAAAEVGFTVKLSGCLLTLKTLPPGGVFTTQHCPVKGQNCSSVTYPLSLEFLGPCGAVTNVQMLKDGNEIAKVAPSGSAAAFQLTVPDASKFSIEFKLVGGAGTTTGTLPILADLTNPAASFVAGTVLGAPVPAGPTALVGKPADVDTKSANHQLHLLLQVDDAGLKGGKLTALKRTVGTGAAGDLEQKSVKLPLEFAAASQKVELQFATLAEDAVNAVVATVTDAVGNTGTAKIDVTVDWKAPSAPVLAALIASDLKARSPSARLTFQAPGGDGSSGKASAYVVRYSRKAIAGEADFAAACDAKELPLAKIPTPSAAGASEQIFVDGPDPRNPSNLCKFSPLVDGGLTNYSFAVAAVDAAGNQSPMSNVVTTGDLRLRYAKIVLQGALDKQDMRTRVSPVGDLNGDGLGDLALGGGSDTKVPLCIVYGRKAGTDGALADVVVAETAGTGYVCLANPGGLGAPVAQPADYNGDGVQDLAVGAGAGSGVLRDVRVYLGKKGGQIATTPAVTIKGFATAIGYGVLRMNSVGNFTGDKSASGQAVDDLAVYTNPVLPGSPQERILIVPGSTAWAEGKNLTIDVNKADDRKANNVGTVQFKTQTGSPFFGNGIFGMGNMIPDGGGTGPQYDDLYAHQFQTDEVLRIIKGRPLVGDQFITLGQKEFTQPDDATAAMIRADSFYSYGIGIFATAFDHDGDGTPDLVVQHQSPQSYGLIGGLYWLSGKTIATGLGKLTILDPPQKVTTDPDLRQYPLGWSTPTWITGLQYVGKFDGQYQAVAFGRPSHAPGKSNLLNIRLFVTRPGTPLGTQTGPVYDDIQIGHPFKSGDTNFAVTANTGWGGISFAATGDFTGDALPDLVAGSNDGPIAVIY